MPPWPAPGPRAPRPGGARLVPGRFRAAEVAGAIGRGLERAGLMPPDLCPLADGGEGTIEALLLALGGETVGRGRPRSAGPPDRASVGAARGRARPRVEMAAASGLGARRGGGARRLGGVDLRHRRADLRRGRHRREVIVGVGGSATADGGAGALEAIAEHGGLGGARIVVLSDVRTPFERAPAVFGPQKGADQAMVARFEERLDELARRSRATRAACR